MKKELTLLLFIVMSIAAEAQQTYYPVTAGNGYGIRFWNSDTYKIHMGNSSEYKYGTVTDYSIKMNMSNTAGRGWTWGVAGATPIASLNTLGNFQVAGKLVALGNVGIGTVTPLTRFHVEYNNSDVPYPFVAMFRGYGTDADDTGGSVFIGSRGNSRGLVIEAGRGAGDQAVTYFKLNRSGGVVPSITQDLMMTFLQGGNVGIGTTTPDSELEVNGDANRAAIILGKENFIGFKRVDGALVYGMGHQNGEFTIGRTTNLGSAAGTPINIASGGSHIRISQGTLERFRISSSGNVGIGTTTPDSKLTVAGKIHAQEVKVTITAGADFVFEESYQPPTLKEVENFIKVNKHLPEIASAKEMETEGLELGEMNIKLLQKIEELTLYTIEQEKSLNQKETKIQVLESKIIDQEERIGKIENLITKNRK